MKSWIKSYWGSYTTLIVMPVVLYISIFIYPDFMANIRGDTPSMMGVVITYYVGIVVAGLLVFKFVLWNSIWRILTNIEKPSKEKQNSGNVKKYPLWLKFVLFIYVPVTIMIYNSRFTNSSDNGALKIVKAELRNYEHRKQVTDLFVDPELYGWLFAWVIFTYATIYFMRLVLNKNISLQLFEKGYSIERVAKTKIGCFFIAFFLNFASSFFITGLKPGILLYSEARWIWYTLDWFYTFTTIQILALAFN